MPLLQLLGNGNPDWSAFLTWIVALAIGITIHEFGHAWRAEKAGDPTPRAMGRVSLNPIDHYDPIGSTLILLVGFGWAKPVPTNPAFFRHPRRDQLMVALWGPLANLIASLVLAVPLWLDVAGPYAQPLVHAITLQVVLAVFNLLPVYPLDGSHILSALLPIDKARRLDAMASQYGPLLLIGVLMVGGQIVWPIVDGVVNLIVVWLGLPVRLLMSLLTGG